MPEALAAGAPHTPAAADVLDFCTRKWDEDIVPALVDYIRVPAKSPAFDADWAANGHLDSVVDAAAGWARRQPLPGLHVEVMRLPGRTPVLLFDLPASGGARQGDTVLFYGHLDKQPEFDGWRSGLGPWTPHYDDGRLYGRGGADDGYALYAALTTLLALRAQGRPHPRCVGLIETCEESGSFDLAPYLALLGERMGRVGLVVCLDSGAGNYEQLWMCTSLRGFVSGKLEVQVLDEGAHSGDAGGIVPSSFRILRHVLDRLEDSATGRLLLPELQCEVPPQQLAQLRQTAAILGDKAWKRFSWHCGGDGTPVLPMSADPEQALLGRAWRASLAVTGADGLPPLRAAGNVLRPRTAFKLALRLPPLVDAARAAQAVKHALEADAPYKARVVFAPDAVQANGWSAPAFEPWLLDALQQASRDCFDAPCAFIGQGGTIPLMGMLEEAFPAAQFMVCGVLGPGSNAHGPNEFLHVPYAKRLTAALAQVLAAAPR